MSHADKSVSLKSNRMNIVQLTNKNFFHIMHQSRMDSVIFNRENVLNVHMASIIYGMRPEKNALLFFLN